MAVNITLNLGFEREFGEKQIKSQFGDLGAKLKDYTNGSDSTNNFTQVVNCCDSKFMKMNSYHGDVYMKIRFGWVTKNLNWVFGI